MIRRDQEPVLRELAGQYPVLTVTGPRQAGKTTLCRAAFPDKADQVVAEVIRAR